MGRVPGRRRSNSFLRRLLVWAVLVFCAAFCAGSALADCNTGFAAFAQMHPRYPRAALARVYWRACLPATSALWRTFGHDKRSLRAFAERFKARRQVVQLYAENGVGRRNRRPGRHDPFRAYSVRRLNVKLKRGDQRPLRVWRALVSEIADFVDTIRGPHTEPILVITLEDDHWDENAELLREEAAGIWPWAISRNPNGNKFPAHDSFGLHEFHGLGVFPDRPDVVTALDGYDFRTDRSQSVRDVRRFLARHRHTHLNFLWTAASQGIFPGPFVYPRKRRFRISRVDESVISELMKH